MRSKTLTGYLPAHLAAIYDCYDVRRPYVGHAKDGKKCTPPASNGQRSNDDDRANDGPPGFWADRCSDIPVFGWVAKCDIINLGSNPTTLDIVN
jgi:hypothetical protein